jgi:hypothetical protein
VLGRRGQAVLTADELGRFGCDDLPRGLVSLRCRTPAGTVVTDWIAL